MAKIYLKTFGCALNQSDSELMAGLLNDAGHKIIQDEKKADLVIINSCTVKNEAENKLYKEIRRHKGKKIVVSGCVPQGEIELLNTKLKGISIVGTTQITKIVEAVQATLNGECLVLIDNEKKERLNFAKIRKNDIIEILPISEGCLGNCAYCKTKHARGDLYSYGPDQIMLQTANAIKDGIKEIWITSQDTGSYGIDIGTTLPKLLKQLLELDGDFRIRLGMCNPNYAYKYLDELAEIFKHPKMFKFIHVPLQSGSNNILRLMNRFYTKEDFMAVVKLLRKLVPKITIATDVIVGFPTESDSEFEETLSLVKELKPDIINLSRFWKRPGTAAESLKELDSKIIKARSIKIKYAFEKFAKENNDAWIGWQGVALIEEKAKNKTFTARNESYKPIIVKDTGQKIGDFVKVKIMSATKWDLRA